MALIVDKMREYFLRDGFDIHILRKGMTDERRFKKKCK